MPTKLDATNQISGGTRLEELSAKIQKLTELFERLEAGEQGDQEIQALTFEIREYFSSLPDLITIVEEIEKQMKNRYWDEINGAVISIFNAIKLPNTQIEELQAQLAQAQNDYQVLLATYDELRTKEPENTTRGKKNRQIGALRQKIAELKAQLKGLGIENPLSPERFSLLQSKLEKQKQEFSQLKILVTALREKIAKLQASQEPWTNFPDGDYFPNFSLGQQLLLERMGV